MNADDDASGARPGGRAHVRPRRGRAHQSPTKGTTQAGGGRDNGAYRPSGASEAGSATVEVRPARVVARSPEREAQARAALRVLFRDYLARGGLDFARASRCPESPPGPSDPAESR